MNPETGCLDVDSVIALVRGTLEAGVSARYRDHLDGCAACRVCVAEAARYGSKGSSHDLQDDVHGGTHDDAQEHDARARELVAGRFRLLAPRGRGTSATVWVAERVDTGARVAVKLLHGDDQPTRRRLRREGEALTKLTHPNIVRILEVLSGDDGLAVGLVMELLDGPSLASIMPHGSPMPLARASHILASVAEALSAAHACGVVHRDLKPAHVLLTGRGEDHLKVVDFGFAKDIAAFGEAGKNGSLLTVSGALLGTPGYMAPEQVFGARHAKASMDVWALGVMAYELLAGRRPLEARGLGQMLKMLARPAIVPLGELRRDLPSALVATVDHMLSADPERRLADLAVFVRAMAGVDGAVGG